ncbi:MAG: thermonuclease family protein [Candidatus Puniceispirillum sp.]|nr:thermonuclease family protein [Candidatus Puniceispirillum sp.]MBT6566553.1 thermonuclease family protein [Candidatus Puniceispirillum sp.]
MNRIAKFYAYLLLICGVGLSVSQPSMAVDSPFDIGGTVTVTRISDGDSLRSGSLRIRLFGIDAPEIKQICHNASSLKWPCGVNARDRLRELVKTAAHLECRLRDTDRYGRLVMQCFANQKDISRTLVEEGMAVAYERYAKEYIAVQAQARDAGRGMWAGTFDMPEDWRKANK